MTQAYGGPVATQSVAVRSRFMQRTYAHLVAAVMAFVALETWLFTSGLAEQIVGLVVSTSWLLVLGGFMVVSWLASSVAVRARSRSAQYGAFAALVVAEALIFTPLLWIARAQAPDVIGQAAVVTLLGFVGLSGIALTTSRDFSFLGSLLRWGGVVVLLLIVAAVLFGLTLGTWFSVAMIAFAGGAVLYDTQKIFRSYPPDREVAAAMSLFASLALLFWYVLRLLSRD
jgi:FtsH-binding integral membrane protein